MSESYTARVEREGRWWVATVPALDQVTQARRFADLPGRLRDLVATWTGVEPEDVDVRVEVVLPTTVREHLAEAERQRNAEAAARTAAAAEIRAAVRELSEAGLSLRDIGAVLGVSFQRAQQLRRSA